ncbi:hypothetical protein SAMN02745866_03380 [Alteromonadaceae bacterium Bs31]|nr:hypothetical protein SAMN02745866_03380 [Alteromonadaceae bacterium Bs31]
MKPIKSKAQIRAEIDEQINSYLSAGGEVKQVAKGISGHTDNSNLFSSPTSFQPKQQRTPVTGLIQQVEERRKSKTTSSMKRQPRPHKKLITDDFGEPLRWVWVDK